MASLEVSAGRLESALAYDRRVVKAAMERVKAAPTSFQARKDLSESWGDLSDVLIRLGRLEEARDANHRYVAQSEELRLSNPDNAGVAGNLAYGHGVRGQILERQGLLREAHASYERSLKAWAERERLGPLEGSEIPERADAAEGLARCAAAISRLTANPPKP
jgi:tetratricopeptide (TPR) repeat protein